jgi:isoleucyl-tRNA synthetase
VALDVTVTDELREEGIAREFVNRIQNLRKESGLEVTDKIKIKIMKHSDINKAIVNYTPYIGSQTLAELVQLVDEIPANQGTEVVLDEYITTYLHIEKI